MVQSWPTFIESNTISVLGVYMKWFSKMANLKSFPRFRFSPLGSYQISQNKFYSVYRWLWNCSVLLLKSRGSFSYFVTLISFRLFVRRAFFLITQTINVTKIGKSDGEKPVHKFIFFSFVLVLYIEYGINNKNRTRISWKWFEVECDD